jgi:hypothetical protein
MTYTFTTADADRLLGLADQFLEEWVENAIQAGPERDMEYEARNAEWQAIRPLLVAGPDMHEALLCPSLEKAHDQLSALLEDPDARNDGIRDAALVMCDALNAFWLQRDTALAKAKGGAPAAKITCLARAQWAERAVIAYAHAKEGREDDPIEEMASDLFADLCHLFVREGVSPEQMMERARLHYEEECTEEGIVL